MTWESENLKRELSKLEAVLTEIKEEVPEREEDPVVASMERRLRVLQHEHDRLVEKVQNLHTIDGIGSKVKAPMSTEIHKIPETLYELSVSMWREFPLYSLRSVSFYDYYDPDKLVFARVDKIPGSSCLAIYIQPVKFLKPTVCQAFNVLDTEDLTSQKVREVLYHYALDNCTFNPLRVEKRWYGSKRYEWNRKFTMEKGFLASNQNRSCLKYYGKARIWGRRSTSFEEARERQDEEPTGLLSLC